MSAIYAHVKPAALRANIHAASRGMKLSRALAMTNFTAVIPAQAGIQWLLILFL